MTPTTHESPLHRPLERRQLLRRMGAAGLALPVLGALGIACDDDEPVIEAAAEATDAHGSPQPTAAQTEAREAVDVPYLPNPEVPPAITRTSAETVTSRLESIDVEGKLADGASYIYWTFDGTVPGPMIRVRAGDTVELTLANRLGNLAPHNIDLHAVTGPGGGAALTNVAPGEEKTFRFQALHPGVYIYHCATPPIDLHISNGMYGLIVVEPEDGLPPVDREFYVCQGEIYTDAPAGSPGQHQMHSAAMADERPTHVVFNGAIGALTGDRALRAHVGERVRVFFGVGGPNLTSSFHVIGEIFDRAATWGSVSAMAEDVQTVSVAPGGATMVEFDVQVPGTYVLVDHALSRLLKGAAGHLVVEGEPQPEIYSAIE